MSEEWGGTTKGRRVLTWETQCEECPERKNCKHDCGHPGIMRFFLDGIEKCYWTGIITQRKIDRTIRDYIDADELPDDVGAYHWEQVEMDLD